ncbi:TPA_asm: hypothetical protein [Metorhabdovirus 2]|nr:TPA_asm: hypothetical protein [Metorhabdovirus 2]
MSGSPNSFTSKGDDFEVLNGLHTYLQSSAAGVTYSSERLRNVQIAKPGGKVNPLWLIPVLTQGVALGNEYRSMVDVLIYGVSDPCPVDEVSLAGLPFEIQDVPLLVHPQVEAIQNLFKDVDRRTAAEVFAPLGLTVQEDITVTMDTLSASCQLIITIAHRLARAMERERGMDTFNRSMIISASQFFPRADINIVDLLIGSMRHTMAYKYFVMGTREIATRVVVLATLKKSRDARFVNYTGFALVGLFAHGFMAYTVSIQAARVLNTLLGPYIGMLPFQFADKFAKTLLEHHAEIMDERSWFIYGYVLIPGMLCPLSATQHPEMTYLSFRIATNKSVEYRVLGDWVIKMNTATREYLDQIADHLLHSTSSTLVVTEGLPGILGRLNDEQRAMRESLVQLVGSTRGKPSSVHDSKPRPPTPPSGDIPTDTAPPSFEL